MAAALSILPNIKPINGINTVDLSFTFEMNRIKSKEIPKQKIIENSILRNKDAVGKNINATNTPIFAASREPEVVGDTNRFCESCCRINPAILIPAPTKTKANVLGTRLIKRNKS